MLQHCYQHNAQLFRKARKYWAGVRPTDVGQGSVCCQKRDDVALSPVQVLLRTASKQRGTSEYVAYQAVIQLELEEVGKRGGGFAPYTAQQWQAT